MRPLTEEETTAVFEKLSKYIGSSISFLIDRDDGKYCFRLHKERVFYVSEELMKKAGNIAGENLLSLGTCFGKFTKTRKFRLHITALQFLAEYGKYKIWLKPSGEQQFLYGHNILKSGVGKMLGNIQQYQGVIVLSMNGTPLGFGVAAKSYDAFRLADPMVPVVFHQADIGEYIRNEEALT